MKSGEMKLFGYKVVAKLNRTLQKMRCISVNAMVITIVAFFALNPLAAQEPTFAEAYSLDSTTADSMTSSIADRYASSKDVYKRNRQQNDQTLLFNALEYEIQNARTMLKRGLKYAENIHEIEVILELRKSALDGIHVDTANALTVRNLVATTILLNEVSRRNESQLAKIKSSNTLFSQAQRRIDSLATIPVLYQVPVDSNIQEVYFQRYRIFSTGYDNTAVKLKNAIDTIRQLEAKGNELKFMLESDHLVLNELQRLEQDNLFSGKEDTFFKHTVQSKSFAVSLVYSLVKGILVLVFYFTNHKISILVMLLLIIGIAYYLKILKRKFINLNH